MNTRQPTAHERSLFDRWQSRITSGRRSMEAMISAAAAAGYGEKFRRDRVPLLAPVLTEAGAREVMQLCDRWNKMERAFAAVQQEQLAIVLTADGRDLDVVQTEPGPISFGIAPLVAVLVIAVAVAGVIALCETLDYLARTQAQLHRAALARLSADMAQQPAPIRDAFRDLMNSEAMKQETKDEGFFGGLGKIAPLAIGALALWFFLPMLSQARPRRSQEAPAENPFRNPCGGDPRTPDQWRVAWSKDPRKAERQLRMIIDDPRAFKDLSGWEGWFTQGMTEEDFGEEVPF